MIKIKVYDEKTHELKREKTCNNKQEYRDYLCNKVDHTCEYAYGTKVK